MTVTGVNDAVADGDVRATPSPPPRPSAVTATYSGLDAADVTGTTTDTDAERRGHHRRPGPPR